VKAEPTLSSGRDSWKSLGTCKERPSGVSTDALGFLKVANDRD
jgi:hypothetical protein